MNWYKKSQYADIEEYGEIYKALKAKLGREPSPDEVYKVYRDGKFNQKKVPFNRDPALV